MTEVERRIKISNYQDEMVKEIYDIFEENDIVIPGHLWNGDYILEVQVFRKDYNDAVDIMRMETPFSCSGSYGMRNQGILVFEFDQI